MEPFIGQIVLFPFNFTPHGWAPCEGQVMPINQNQVVFALLGVNFGGDGIKTFALPDLRGKEPVPSTRYFIALQGIFPNRD
jgi:microcystin-dependent protein